VHEDDSQYTRGERQKSIISLFSKGKRKKVSLFGLIKCGAAMPNVEINKGDKR
jgi:hypothetical protein